MIFIFNYLRLRIVTQKYVFIACHKRIEYGLGGTHSNHTSRSNPIGGLIYAMLGLDGCLMILVTNIQCVIPSVAFCYAWWRPPCRNEQT